MDGLLILDKPSGPTSHDVVARVRRILRERRVGHTGTLDPLASGVLPLVVGRATRLARFLEGDKQYDAAIRLGVDTDTYDLHGHVIGTESIGPWPDRPTVEAALARFVGTFLQRPPAFSAKKIDGERSYAIARRARQRDDQRPDTDVPAPTPAPVAVTTTAIDVLDINGPIVRLRIHCEAGFYVRSLAYDLGKALGLGGHLIALRRIEAAGLRVDRAIPLDDFERAPDAGLATSLVPMDRMLASLPSVALTDVGLAYMKWGRDLGPAETTDGFAQAMQATHEDASTHVRLLDQLGHLVAVAEAAVTPGLLHPSVVLM
jgi:tRNA pseudouridine55 synthase